MGRPGVVFVCRHGSAKSVIAASSCARLAGRRGLAVDAESAGVEPDASLPANVVSGLGADGIDVSGARPRGPGVPRLVAELERAG